MGGLDGGDEAFDVVVVVVGGEGSPDGGRDAEAAHDGFGTVLTDADSDAVLVENGAGVVRVDAVQGEGDDGGFVVGGADDAQAGQGSKCLFCRLAQGFYFACEGS